MLVDKDELLTWASASDAHAERAEAVQAELEPGPAWSPGSGGARWRSGMWRPSRAGSRSPPALLAAQLRAALTVPVELARGPIGTLEVYAAGPRDWTDSKVAALQAYAGVVIEQAKGVLMGREGLSRHGSAITGSSQR